MHFSVSLLLLLATTALLTSSEPLPLQPPGQPSECALSLVALSPCLSYIAGPPNRAASSPSVICCGTFYQTIMTAGPACVCYLVRDPLILGFPIDTGRLVAMFPSCGVNNTATAVRWLYDTCRVTEIETMSPLPGIAPAPVSTIIQSSADQWAQGHPTSAKSNAPCQIRQRWLWRGLLVVGLMLLTNLLI
ncbi:putative lipid transfer [Carex littledalei]|uniref:Putative lipid transfer n=1 Tax=Carex littledalei TaxID=544730 RepID=A0A833QTS9_9POAL|nr:putative lipid transfer [Carex littledalei]